VLDDLTERFPHPDVRFHQKGALVLAELANAHGTAIVTPFGATVLSYIPRGGEEVLWVSEAARFDGAKAIRGGIPVCWPWFGPHPTDPGRQPHGIARDQAWAIESVRSVDAGTEIVLCLGPTAAIRNTFPHDFALRLVVTLGEALDIQLVGENCSSADWPVSEALHAYFRVARAPGMGIAGLEGIACADKLGDGIRSIPDNPLRVDSPMDRVFLDHFDPVELDDAGNGRRIRIEKSGSASTVVWNPGPEGARNLGDMPDDGYQRMLCVEAANALENAYTLPAGGRHSLGMRLSAQPLPV
jgi:glucose-6-phosphate 1-epimerase